MLFVNHVTWCVNSVCHIWGKRDFKTDDNSKNNAVIAILAFGEGNHNTHHAFPNSSRHGLFKWPPDLSYWFIKFLELCRLAWDVDQYIPSKEAMDRKRI